MKQRFGAYRRSAEVYFVLYLCALILLLPNKREHTTSSEVSLVRALLEMNFTVVPSKPVLNCRLLPSAEGLRILEFDSSNVLYATGNVENVQYEFTIEDVTARQILRVSDNAPSPYFRTETDVVQKSARFFWRVNAKDVQNRTLLVRVTAHAKPIVPPALKDNIHREQLNEIISQGDALLTAKTEFALNITIAGNSTQITQSEIQPSMLPLLSSGAFTTQNGNLPQNSGTNQVQSSAQTQPSFLNPQNFVQFAEREQQFYLVPRAENLDKLPAQQWENMIAVYGANPAIDFVRPLQIAVLGNQNGDGTAQVAEIRENALVISGVAPILSAMTVRISAQRKSDSRVQTAEFTVRPNAVPAPEFPKQMYALQQYIFKPNLPLLRGQEARAVLSDGQQDLYVSNQGASFTFTPQMVDIGKTLKFERFVGGKKYGETYFIQILSVPPPEILETSLQGNSIIVKTRSFGGAKGSENRVRISVQKRSNVGAIRELYGNNYFDSQSRAYIQFFEIRRADPDKSMSGILQAKDDLGNTSKEEPLD